MRDEQFGFWPRHITYLQLVCHESWQKVSKRRRLPRQGQSLRYRRDWWPPLQPNIPKRPVLHSPYNPLLPPGSNVLSVLPDSHVISSRHASWVDSGWINLSFLFVNINDMPSPSHHVEQFPLCGRHGHHSHVTQADAARPLPRVISQRPSICVESMENCP